MSYIRGVRKNWYGKKKLLISVARVAGDGVAELNDKIYFVGGNNFSSDSRYCMIATILRQIHGKRLANMSVVRGRLAVAVLDGKLYAIGGVG